MACYTNKRDDENHQAGFASKKFRVQKTALQRHRESVQHKQAPQVHQTRSALKLVFKSKRMPPAHTKRQQQFRWLLSSPTQSTSYYQSILLDLLKTRAPQNIQEAKSLQEMKLGATKCTNLIPPRRQTFYAQELVLRYYDKNRFRHHTIDDHRSNQAAKAVYHVVGCKCLNDRPSSQSNRSSEYWARPPMHGRTRTVSLMCTKYAHFKRTYIPLSNILRFSSDNLQCNIWAKI